MSRRLRFFDEKCNVRKWRRKKFSLSVLWLFLINELRKKENVRVWDSLLSSWLHKHFLYFQKVLKRGSKKKETIWRRTEVMYNSWLLKFLSRLSKKEKGRYSYCKKVSVSSIKISSKASNDHDITYFKFVEDNFELRINTLQK